MIVALTGATGFVGRATLDVLHAKGHTVRALARVDQPPREGMVWVEGRLEDEDALARLVDGADAILHIAGVVRGSADAFVRGNVDGTRHMIAAARSAGIRRLVHVSSLAAREPQLSSYGDSKHRAETEVMQSGLDWSIVRPPGVYGPGDMEMRDVFRMAKFGVVLLPPAGRLSMIHVADLARLLMAEVEQPGTGETYECDDGATYTHRQFARAVGVAVGRNPFAFSVPAPVLKAAARADLLFRRSAAKLTPDRAAYLSHPDWTADPAKRPPADLWVPAIPAAQGLAETAAWYSEARLL